MDSLITKAEKVLGSQVNKTQEALFEQMSLLLNKLDLLPDGTIKQSQANRAILGDAGTYFNKAFNQSGYYDTLGGFTETVISITAANEAYFTVLLDTFTIDAQYIKSLQKSSILQLQSLLANEGLEAQVKTPILNILNQNINTGASFYDLNKQLRQVVLGDAERDGKLKRYSSQIVTDTLFNFGRSMQESISNKAGLQFVVYLGGLVKDSRDFCVERSGNYYHRSEVEQWAALEWSGKRPDTTESTIFIYAGGWRCAHQIIYVSEFVVPPEVIERAKEAGFYE